MFSSVSPFYSVQDFSLWTVATYNKGGTSVSLTYCSQVLPGTCQLGDSTSYGVDDVSHCPISQDHSKSSEFVSEAQWKLGKKLILHCCFSLVKLSLSLSRHTPDHEFPDQESPSLPISEGVSQNWEPPSNPWHSN